MSLVRAWGARPPHLPVAAGLLLLLGALALGPACRGVTDDEGPRILAEVESEYRTLVEGGVSRNDPRLAALRRKLDTVPPQSRAQARAETLKDQLDALLAPLPPRPLAVPRPSALDAGEACVEEAKLLGEASTLERPRRLQALRECRERAERHLSGHAHPGADGGAPPDHGH